MENDHLYEITVYTENQVGLLSSIAGIFTRRSLNIEKLLAYPSRLPGIHKFKLTTRTNEIRVREVTKQLEKKVDVVKAFYQIDNERSEKELKLVREFLEERENNR